MQTLVERWIQAAESCAWPKANNAKIIDEILGFWQEPHRFYHTIAHLEHGLGLLGQFSAQPVSIIAWFLHDLVYDPKAHDNEAAPAAWAHNLVAACAAPAGDIDRIQTLILATAHPQNTPDKAMARAQRDEQLALFLDVDLAILATEPAQYQAYTAAVRREFQHVSDKDFARGRARLLMQWLTGPIYCSTLVPKQWNHQAHANIRAELCQLENNT